MRRFRLVAALLFCAAAAYYSAAPTTAQTAPDATDAPAATNPPLPSPKPAAEIPAVRKLAVQQFLAWQSGTVNRDLYSDTINSELTDDMLDRGTKTLANLGGLQRAVFDGISLSNGSTFYVYDMVCQNGTVKMEFALDPKGKIALIFFE